MEIKITLSLLVGLSITVSAMLFMREYLSLRKRVNDIEERMKKLELAKNKRMPYEALESLLDAQAALDREKEEYELYISLIGNAQAHLKKAMTVGTKKGE